MHSWGDKGVDWEGINRSAGYIAKYCRKVGRLGGSAKEKYGTVRFYAMFGNICLHTLVYPGYAFNQFPSWLWKLDLDYIGPFLQFFFEKLFVRWQQFIYNKAYQNALKKWPHLRAEILVSADWPELIKGVTRKEGNKTHVVGWHGEILTTWEDLTNDT